MWEYSGLLCKPTFIALVTCETSPGGERQSERRCLYGRMWTSCPKNVMSVGIKTVVTLQDVPGVSLIEISTVGLACSKNVIEVTNWLPVWEHPVAVCLLTHPSGLWHVDEGFLVGHYLQCGDKHIALISSAIISSGQTGAEPTKAGRLASLLLTYLHCLTDSLFAHFHCGNKIRSNYKVPGLSAYCISRWAAYWTEHRWH